ncbi:hypothetical protein [Tepidibacillus marianensis]|uniref:hypothetical protein n=1 Tax=Tepidibacillus marianensis TaxID=3131995 RepID=UPI0030D1E723
MTKSRNILASFKTADEAQQAGRELQLLGIQEMRIDRVSLYPGYNLNNLSNPLTGRFESLAELTLGSDFTNKNAEILATADVSASGLSDGGNMDIDRNVLLTVVADETLADQAEQVINKYNGMF